MTKTAMTKKRRRMIFAGCKSLGLDDEARRDLVTRVTGKESLKDCDAGAMLAVVEELKRLGFKPVPKKGRAPAPRADLRLVHVLWRQLGEAGKLKDSSRAGLNAFVRSQFGAAWGSVPADIDMLRDHGQISAVIRALQSWLNRK